MCGHCVVLCVLLLLVNLEVGRQYQEMDRPVVRLEHIFLVCYTAYAFSV